MSIKNIIKWQWDDYTKYHKSRANLLLHIFTVPVFLVGLMLFIWNVFDFNAWPIFYSILCMASSIAIQGIGHGQEQYSPEPFTSVTNAVFRIMLEQLYTFPKFVLTGGWLNAYRNNNAN